MGLYGLDSTMQAETIHVSLTRILEGAEDRVLTLVCDMNDWEYRKSSYDADLPLKTTENTESSKSLGNFF